jgi:hypothetical protein
MASPEAMLQGFAETSWFERVKIDDNATEIPGRRSPRGWPVGTNGDGAADQDNQSEPLDSENVANNSQQNAPTSSSTSEEDNNNNNNNKRSHSSRAPKLPPSIAAGLRAVQPGSLHISTAPASTTTTTTATTATAPASAAETASSSSSSEEVAPAVVSSTVHSSADSDSGCDRNRLQREAPTTLTIERARFSPTTEQQQGRMTNNWTSSSGEWIQAPQYASPPGRSAHLRRHYRSRSLSTTYLSSHHALASPRNMMPLSTRTSLTRTQGDDNDATGVGRRNTFSGVVPQSTTTRFGNSTASHTEGRGVRSPLARRSPQAAFGNDTSNHLRRNSREFGRVPRSASATCVNSSSSSSSAGEKVGGEGEVVDQEATEFYSYPQPQSWLARPTSTSLGHADEPDTNGMQHMSGTPVIGALNCEDDSSSSSNTLLAQASSLSLPRTASTEGEQASCVGVRHLPEWIHHNTGKQGNGSSSSSSSSSKPGLTRGSSIGYLANVFKSDSGNSNNDDEYEYNVDGCGENANETQSTPPHHSPTAARLSTRSAFCGLQNHSPLSRLAVEQELHCGNGVNTASSSPGRSPSLLSRRFSTSAVLDSISSSSSSSSRLHERSPRAAYYPRTAATPSTFHRALDLDHSGDVSGSSVLLPNTAWSSSASSPTAQGAYMLRRLATTQSHHHRTSSEADSQHFNRGSAFRGLGLRSESDVTAAAAAAADDGVEGATTLVRSGSIHDVMVEQKEAPRLVRRSHSLSDAFSPLERAFDSSTATTSNGVAAGVDNAAESSECHQVHEFALWRNARSSSISTTNTTTTNNNNNNNTHRIGGGAQQSGDEYGGAHANPTNNSSTSPHSVDTAPAFPAEQDDDTSTLDHHAWPMSPPVPPPSQQQQHTTRVPPAHSRVHLARQTTAPAVVDIGRRPRTMSSGGECVAPGIGATTRTTTTTTTTISVSASVNGAASSSMFGRERWMHHHHHHHHPRPQSTSVRSPTPPASHTTSAASSSSSSTTNVRPVPPATTSGASLLIRATSNPSGASASAITAKAGVPNVVVPAPPLSYRRSISIDTSARATDFGALSRRTRRHPTSDSPRLLRASRQQQQAGIHSEYTPSSGDGRNALATAAEFAASSAISSSTSSSQTRLGGFGGVANSVPQQHDVQLQQQHDTALSSSSSASSSSFQSQLSSPENPLSPEAVAPFEWVRGVKLGHGTFGMVYLALNQHTGALFAVKQVPITATAGGVAAAAAPAAAHRGTSGGRQQQMTTVRSDGVEVGTAGSGVEGGGESTERENKQIRALQKEINLMRKLEHPHIVSYISSEWDKENRVFNIFLEYVSGGSLSSMLTQFGPFEDRLVRLYTNHIVSGVQYLHDKGIAHRDIKGANVLVNDKGIAKLADFGCSKQFAGMHHHGGGKGSLEATGLAFKGSVPWMAPEVVQQSSHGRKSDIWSIGCTVIEMMTAKLPWPDYENAFLILYQLATKQAPPMPASASPEAQDFIRLCLELDPVARATAGQLSSHPFLTADSA